MFFTVYLVANLPVGDEPFHLFNQENLSVAGCLFVYDVINKIDSNINLTMINTLYLHFKVFNN